MTGANNWISQYWASLPLLLAGLGVIVGSPPLIAIGVFLFLAGAVGLYWSRHVFDRLVYERRIPQNRAFAGETVSLTLRLTNDKLLPVPWIEVRDPVPEGVLQDEKHISPAPSPNYVYLSRSTHLGAYERINWPLEFKAPARGYYRMGPAKFSSGDIFGFFPAQEDADERLYDPIIIYPTLYNLPELGLPPQRPFGEQKGRDRIFEDPQRIAGLRDYRPGDPLRRIDWKATARRQALQSWVYEPSSTLHMLIAVNVHTRAHSWEGYVPELLENVISVAGSIARYGFEAGYGVGLVANGSYPASDRPMRIPVGRRSDQLARILEALAVIGPLTLVSLETVLDREAQSFPFGATLVCVTGRLEPPLAASLQRVAGAGHAVVLLSLSDEDKDEDLGPGVRVFNLAAAMRALAARDVVAGEPA
jgi:uncharacterized protein (DUF58 family)